MSGGSRNYICHRIEDELCGRMYDAEINDLMEDVCKLAHDAEWCDSGDIGKDTYFKSVMAFKEKWFASDRTERLQGYIDNALAETKRQLYRLIGVDEVGGE